MTQPPEPEEPRRENKRVPTWITMALGGALWLWNNPVVMQLGKAAINYLLSEGGGEIETNTPPEDGGGSPDGVPRGER